MCSGRRKGGRRRKKGPRGRGACMHPCGAPQHAQHARPTKIDFSAVAGVGAAVLRVVVAAAAASNPPAPLPPGAARGREVCGALSICQRAGGRMAFGAPLFADAPRLLWLLHAVQRRQQHTIPLGHRARSWLPAYCAGGC